MLYTICRNFFGERVKAFEGLRPCFFNTCTLVRTLRGTRPGVRVLGCLSGLLRRPSAVPTDLNFRTGGFHAGHQRSWPLSSPGLRHPIDTTTNAICRAGMNCVNGKQKTAFAEMRAKHHSANCHRRSSLRVTTRRDRIY